MKSAAGATENYVEIDLDDGRLDEALALVAEAGWNQTAADWHLLIREGRTLGLARREDDALVASATVLPLGPALSWIGMVLVTAAERRRGHATRLMNRCMAAVEAVGAVAGLDATPAGREVYRGLGFDDVAGLLRLGLTDTSGLAGCGAGIRPVRPADLSRLLAYDRTAFGADRSAVLSDLHGRLPGAAFLAETEGRPSGFVLARPGRLATQIGPLVADGMDSAERLLAAALGAASGPVIVDAFRESADFLALLRGLGFEDQRPFVRMLKGRTKAPHDPLRYLLAAGPELG